MWIDLRSHSKIGSGVYADVFADDGKAYKLFKSGPEIPPRQTRVGRRRVFESQCEAYVRASGDSFLKDHVASFYGPCVIQNIVDENGVSIAADYMLDCCYALERFGYGETDFKANAEWVRECEHIKSALVRLDRIGISLLDLSVFRYADPDGFKFIDIELRDYY
jgi:hypothetical protein